MPDVLGGAGLGAGGGAIAAAVVYAMDRAFGSGRTIKHLDDKVRELREDLSEEIGAIRRALERVAGHVQRLHDWHDVADPDDPSGKLWYFSVALRRAIDTLGRKVSRLLELLDDLVRRFDRYNETMERLITVVEKLRRDVDALGVVVAGMDQSQRRR